MMKMTHAVRWKRPAPRDVDQVTRKRLRKAEQGDLGAARLFICRVVGRRSLSLAGTLNHRSSSLLGAVGAVLAVRAASLAARVASLEEGFHRHGIAARASQHPLTLGKVFRMIVFLLYTKRTLA
jgi:hypothetical protein